MNDRLPIDKQNMETDLLTEVVAILYKMIKESSDPMEWEVRGSRYQVKAFLHKYAEELIDLVEEYDTNK